MKIKPFADISGISTDRIYRYIKTTDWTGKKTGPGNGMDLTMEQQAILRAALPADKPSKEPPYAYLRKEWLQKWNKAYEAATDPKQKAAILAVSKGIINAKDRAWLDGACEGARNGDLLVELAYAANADYKVGQECEGFTRYLLDNGFESPGWDIL